MEALKMEIGIGTDRLFRFGERRYQVVAAAGFKYLDYDLSNTETAPYTLDPDEFKAYLLHEKEMIEAEGLEFCQMHGPWRWPSKDRTPEELEERMEKMTRSLEAASIFGCKNWVIHPIMPFGHFDIGSGNEEATWEKNVVFMSEILHRAKEFGVTVCFENLPFTQFSMSTPSDVLRFAKEMNDDNFKICLDTGHVAVFPDLTPGNAMRELGDYVEVLHVHDNDGKVDWHRNPYYGVIDWEDFKKSLRDTNFKGVLSLETAPPKHMPLDAAESMYIAMAQIARTLADI